jgi:hypothetical protein
MSVFGLFITSLAGALFCALIYIYSRVRANHAPDQRRALKAGTVCLALAGIRGRPGVLRSGDAAAR